MDCSAGCTEIAGPFETQYELSLATIRVKIAEWPAMQHRRRHDSRVLSSSAASRIARIRRLLICTRVGGLLTCTTTNHPCIITVGENCVATDGHNVAGRNGENRGVHHQTG